MMSPDAYIHIFEEPASNSTRFRYESEGRSAPLEGVSSTPERRSFPSIRVPNYTGKATVIVSCVTADEPFWQHPHKLVGRNCVDGICYIPEFYTDSKDPTILSFSELRIQSCLKSGIPEELKKRKLLNINPFNLSMYEDDLKRDIHTVRLCFQVLITPDPKNPDLRTQFEPEVSQPIINNKDAEDLNIHDISDTCSPVSGGKKIMIFCNKITKKDIPNIRLRFFEEDSEKNETFIGWGDFQPSNVHRNVAIAFKTPKYNRTLVDKSPDMFIEMVRLSDNARSDRLSFQYIPDATDIDAVMLRKQQKFTESKNLFEYLGTISHNNFPSYVQKQKEQEPSVSQQHSVSQLPIVLQQYNITNVPHNNNIPEQVNLPQDRNMSQQHQNVPQEPITSQRYNIPQQFNIPQNNNIQQEANIQQHQISPYHFNLPHQHNLPQQHNLSQPNILLQHHNLPHQHPINYEEDIRAPTTDEILDEIVSQEDQIMLSANDNCISEHTIAGPSAQNWDP